MTEAPRDQVSLIDIPAAVPGAASYAPRDCKTGGCDVVMTTADGDVRVVDHKPSEQAAIRACIRIQRRENMVVSK